MRCSRAQGDADSCALTMRPYIPPTLPYKVVGEMLFVPGMSDGRVPMRKEDDVEKSVSAKSSVASNKGL
jgi:hypothetical protein